LAKRRRAELIYDRLLRSLASGQWPSGERLPATRTLERQYHCSHMNMLAAIGIAAENQLLRVKPRKPVTVMPNAAERARDLLRQRATRADIRRLALLLPESFGDVTGRIPFFGDLQAAIELQARRFDIDVERVRWPLADQVSFVQQLPNKGFGAAFTLGARAEYLPSLYALHQQRFPLVLLNAQIPELSLPSVNLDEYAAMRQLAERLANLGHRNMCLMTLAVDSRLKTQRHRVFAWLDFLKETGLGDACSIPVCCVTTENEAVRYARQILSMPNRPTAMVFAYGALCLPFPKEPPVPGLRVPRDLSVATFDVVQTEVANAWCPPLTSIVPDMTRVAQCVVEMIEKLLVGETDVPNIRVPMRINMTDSIGPPPA
jgi:DNA-binding LacI/PurR family transcriptional regulator